MNIKFAKKLASLLLMVGMTGLSGHALAVENKILPPPIQVSPHVYAWIGPHGSPNQTNKGYRMNLCFVVGKDAVAVIETGYHEPMAREMLAHIAKITRAPVKYVINSNSQADRFLGSEYFRRQGATIIASAPEAVRMAEMGGLFAQINESAMGLKVGSIQIPNPPDRILTSDTELDLGGVRLKLHIMKAAHTPGPIVVHIPQDNIVYAGDVLYSGRLPGVIEGGNVQSWIQVFNQLRSFGNVKFIPGHGKPAQLAAFEFSTLGYLTLLHNHMTAAVKKGLDQQDAIATLDQSAFSKLENYPELAGRNASFAYRETEAASF